MNNIKNSKKEIIKKIEEKRQSLVIAYIAGDKPNFGTKIADDVIPLFYNLLKDIGKVKKLDLFLYSRGGSVLTPWRLVNLLREFTDYFSILIPFRAHSAATLIALGADEIVMTPLAELSPIDPSITTPFNPRSDLSQNKPIPISVEDIINYFELARKELKIEQATDLAEIFLKLADKLDPIALGRIYRSYLQIRHMASQLMTLSGYDNMENINKEDIIEKLTQKLYSHESIICRREAKEYGLRVVKAEEEVAGKVEDLLWELYAEFSRELQLDIPFNPQKKYEEENISQFNLPRAVIENRIVRYVFSSNITIHKEKIDQHINYNINVGDLGWIFEK
jgi:hypothetical protein